MNESVPVLRLTERQIVDVIERANRTLAAAVALALKEATEQAAEDMRAVAQEQSAPTLSYFASVVHQRMYCLMCGADPDTFEGGNADIAYSVIRNSQNIAKHYWAADIEPYQPK